MPMKMGWRWYGEGNDPISLSDIKQIPGVTSIVWALHDKMPGEIWEIDEIQKVADQIHAYGFDMDVVESVNVHDDIKIGLPTRDKYIENYKQCIRNLSKFGVKVICYNFMPVFDWTVPICSTPWATAPLHCSMRRIRSRAITRLWLSTSCPSLRSIT